MKLYAERDAIKQGQHYLRHVEAMTAEGLHSKADIAAELAHRDIEIERLRDIEAEHAAFSNNVIQCEAENDKLHGLLRAMLDGLEFSNPDFWMAQSPECLKACCAAIAKQAKQAAAASQPPLDCAHGSHVVAGGGTYCVQCGEPTAASQPQEGER